MPPTLLTSLINVGEQLCDAVCADDWEAFFALMDERAAFVDRLRAFDHASELDPEWEKRGEALADQYERLNRALSERREQLQRALVHIEEWKDAQTHYDEAPAGRLRVLRDDVMG